MQVGHGTTPAISIMLRITRQITEAFPWDQAPSYLIRDRFQPRCVWVSIADRFAGAAIGEVAKATTSATMRWLQGMIPWL
jgi:hypothetical protein